MIYLLQRTNRISGYKIIVNTLHTTYLQQRVASDVKALALHHLSMQQPIIYFCYGIMNCAFSQDCIECSRIQNSESNSRK